MILGASLPGMIFPAQRPAEGSNSYHYGSYATSNQYCRQETDWCVSIPLWFLRNPLARLVIEVIRISFHTTMVLTKQQYPCRKQNFKAEFPYHYGSYATVILGHTTGIQTIRFPYHYGSYATSSGSIFLVLLLLVSIPLWFLRNTRRRRTAKTTICVSIPLWFLRNANKQLAEKLQAASFHTTMVLTQRSYGTLSYS